jgi:hypothetical protein
MNIRLVTVIWGAPFVDLFLHVALRSLMAAGNLPDLSRSHSCRWTIYTTAEDAERLRASPLFAAVSELVDVDLSIFGLGEIDPANRGSHAILWQRGLELARRNRETLFLLIPDLVYAEGTLTRWAQRFAEGYRAVYTPGPFVALETALPEIEARATGDGIIAIGQDEMLEMLLRHMHPAEAAMFRDSPRRTQHPEHDLRALDGQGFVMRVFTSQPFCIDPNHFVKITMFNVEDHLDDICFEPFSVLSCEPLMKTAEWLYRPAPLDQESITRLGAWWRSFSPKGTIAESAHLYDFSRQTNEVSPHLCARAANGGRFLRAQLLLSLGIYRLWEWTTSSICDFWPAVFLATAHHVLPLRRKLVVSPESVIFMPRGEVLLHAENGWVWDCLKLGQERELQRLMLAHLFTPHLQPDGTRRWISGNGEDLAVLGFDPRIVSGPHVVDGLTVYQVDDLLLQPLGEAASPRAGAAQTVAPQLEPVSSAAVPQSKFARLHPRRVARGVLRRLRRLAGWTLRLPGRVLRLTGRILRQLGRLVVRPLPPLGRAVHRLLIAIVFWMKGIRALRFLAEPAAKLLRVWEAEGAAGIRKRLAGRYPHVGYMFGRLKRRASPVTAPLLRIARLVPRGLRYIHRYGALAAVQRASTLVSWRIDLRPGDVLMAVRGRSPTPDSRKSLEAVMNVRALHALADVLTHYQAAALGGARDSAPLGYIRSLLGPWSQNNAETRALLESKLVEIVRKHAFFAEAWLELGFLRLDGKDYDGALQAFTRAYSGRLYLEKAAGTCDSRALALVEAARLLVARGGLSDAAGLLVRAQVYEPHNRAYNLELAKVQRSLGNTRDAAQNFFWAMPSHQFRYRAFSNARHASELDLMA